MDFELEKSRAGIVVSTADFGETIELVCYVIDEKMGKETNRILINTHSEAIRNLGNALMKYAEAAEAQENYYQSL